MATRQDAQIIKQMFNTTGLRPKLKGISSMDERGNLVYDTGDIVSPGSGEVVQMGSQLTEALANLPKDRTFQKLAKRGKFEGTALGSLSMLGAPGVGRNAQSSTGGAAATAFMGQPDVGRSVASIRQAMEESNKEKGNADYDERGRRKTFGMLGDGMFGMPAPGGPLTADRMPYQDVLTGATPDKLMNLPGVSAVSGSADAVAKNAALKSEEEAAAKSELEQKQKLQQAQEVITMLQAGAGDRSASYDPSGKVMLGAPPKPPAPVQQKPQNSMMELAKMLGNPSGAAKSLSTEAAAEQMPAALEQMARIPESIPAAIRPMLEAANAGAGAAGFPQIPTIGGRLPSQPQQNPQQTGRPNLGRLDLGAPEAPSPGAPSASQPDPTGMRERQQQAVLQEYQRMYPNKSPEEIMRAARARGVL